MVQSISFIHAADLHIDSPFKGLTHIPESIFPQVRKSTFQAVDNLVTTAINKQVDFVLLVGDLFDHEMQSIQAQVHLKKAFEKLQNHHIQVYLSYGNHDFIKGNIHPITFPENVFIFSDEQVTSFTFEKDNQKIASIYGFSYENRSVITNKSLEFDVKNESIPFHIAMLHGTVHGNKAHERYAPFRLQDLQEKHFDYWALGHIHKREQLSLTPPIIYPGNIQGRHRNETGEKGCYYVELSKNQVVTEFIPLQSIQFQNITVDVTTCKTVYDMVEKLLQTVGHKDFKSLIHLTLFSQTEQLIALDSDGHIEELLDIVNESLMMQDPWNYIYTYRTQIDDTFKFKHDDFFVGEIIDSLEEISVKQAVSDLYNHPVGRKFLADIPQKEITKKAKQVLMYELLQIEEGE
ncbi:MAG TPA: DNA repair exonuclease [Pseudogracilibacillus sp.]|nr:DNA repair exonuclease [Pseudogracilibacillus sp.]